MSSKTGFAAIRKALGNRTFRLFTSGSVVSSLGTWAQRVGVQWLTWQLTESGTWLGIVAFADLFPTVVLAPLTGAMADRVDRRKAMMVTQCLLLSQAATIAALEIAGIITIEWLVALVAFGGAVMSFNQPARLALIPSLVPREDLPSAIGINSLTFNGARFIGPMIAGLLIASYGVGACFAFNAVSYLTFIVALVMISLAPVARDRARAAIGDIPREIVAGYGYAVRHVGIGRMLVILTAVSIFGRAYYELLPGFADHVFGRGAQALSMMTSMVGLGAMLGGFWLAQRGAVQGLTAVSVTAVLVMNGALLGFAATAVFWVALPCLVVVGFGMIVLGVGEQTLIQNALDPAMRGRVMGLYGMIGRGAPAVGALIMGWLSGFVGFQWPVTGGALVCIGVWLWAHRRRDAIAASLEVERAG